MAVLSRETLWKHTPAHLHRKMTTAFEPVGVSIVFPPLPFYLEIHVLLVALAVALDSDK